MQSSRTQLDEGLRERIRAKCPIPPITPWPHPEEIVAEFHISLSAARSVIKERRKEYEIEEHRKIQRHFSFAEES